MRLDLLKFTELVLGGNSDQIKSLLEEDPYFRTLAESYFNRYKKDYEFDYEGEE